MLGADPCDTSLDPQFANLGSPVVDFCGEHLSPIGVLTFSLFCSKLAGIYDLQNIFNLIIIIIVILFHGWFQDSWYTEADEVQGGR